MVQVKISKKHITRMTVGSVARLEVSKKDKLILVSTVDKYTVLVLTL